MQGGHPCCCPPFDRPVTCQEVSAVLASCHTHLFVERLHLCELRIGSKADPSFDHRLASLLTVVLLPFRAPRRLSAALFSARAHGYGRGTLRRATLLFKMLAVVAANVPVETPSYLRCASCGHTMRFLWRRHGQLSGCGCNLPADYRSKWWYMTCFVLNTNNERDQHKSSK